MAAPSRENQRSVAFNIASAGNKAVDGTRLPFVAALSDDSIVVLRMEAKHVLLVEPDCAVSSILRDAIGPFARVNPQGHFIAARSDLKRGMFDLIVTNLRLEDYNGLHLAYLAATESYPARSIVYTGIYEPSMARQIRRAGAFYETAQMLPHTIAAYLTNNLPLWDRRNAVVRDRRQAFRGGRRRSDVHSLHPGQ